MSGVFYPEGVGRGALVSHVLINIIPTGGTLIAVNVNTVLICANSVVRKLKL